MTRQEMIDKLEQYKMENGYYDIAAIIADEQPQVDSLSLTFATFFGDDEEQNPAGESELVTLARELNAQIGLEQEREQIDEADNLITELETATGTRRNQIYHRLQELGIGQSIGDADNLHFVFNRPHGSQYDDQGEVGLSIDDVITLAEAAEIYPLAYSSLAQAAREHRIDARRSGTTWLTTRSSIEHAITTGQLHPRKSHKKGGETQ